MSSPSTRSNRLRIAVDAPIRGRSRDGCWTCRIRRKKCDEHQDPETGRCGNCSRLQVDCVGWGERRPDWIKDPQQMAAFKAMIKSQIMSRSKASGPADQVNVILNEPVPVMPILSEDHDHPQLGHDASCSYPPEQSFESETLTVSSCSPSLTLPAPLIPHPSSLTERCDYSSLVRHVRTLAGNAELPVVCLDAIEQTARLGLWKQGEYVRGALSYKELARRGLVLEELLVSAYERQKAAFLASDPRSSTPSESNGEEMFGYIRFNDEEEETHSNSSFDSLQTLADPSPIQTVAKSTDDWSVKAERFYSPATDAIALSDASSPIAIPFEEEYPDWGYIAEQNKFNKARGSPQDLPYLTALLFLYSVVSGPNPRVPEIADVSGKVLDILVCPTIGSAPLLQRLLSASLVCLLAEGKGEEKARNTFLDIYNTPKVNDHPSRESGLALMEKRISTA